MKVNDIGSQHAAYCGKLCSYSSESPPNNHSALDGLLKDNYNQIKYINLTLMVNGLNGCQVTNY